MSAPTPEDEVVQLRQEVERLTLELEDTNRGVVALLTELEQKAEALRRSNELKSRFLSTVSHELRTPIHSILNLAGLLLRRFDGELTSEQEKQVRFIAKAGESLTELINDLLDLAKIEAGKVSVKPAEFTLEQLFLPLRGQMKSLPRSADVALVFELPEDGPPLLTDEAKVAQILRNLISNALKFTATGEVRVSARYLSHDRIGFSVSDTGPGIPPEDQQRIFEEFVQLDVPSSSSTKGTGLGLPLSRHFAELLGGSLTLESSSAGSTFRCELPRVVDLSRTSGIAGTRILVTDDEDSSRYVLVRMLTPLGAQVFEASSARHALEQLEATRPDLLVLDLRMPGTDGWHLLDQLRASERHRHLPVLVRTSARLSPIDQERLALQGATVIGKEATPERLGDVLRRLLEKRAHPRG